MAQDTLELKETEFMIILREGSAEQQYGLWNILAAENNQGQLLGWFPAHDGDFYPESPLDHVEALRTARIKNKSVHCINAWPVRVDIDIMQQCNCNCIFCYSRSYATQSMYADRLISKRTLSEVLEELVSHGTRTIRFTGGGEPLLHPEILEILPLPRKNGLRSCVITNGDLLNDQTAKIILEHVDHLRWSVNAATGQTRKRLHRPKPGALNLLETMQRVGWIIEQRTHRQTGQLPMVWATFLIVPSNLNEAITATKQLREIGVDSLSFRPIYHSLGENWKPGDADRLADIFEQVQTLADPPRFCVFTPKRHLEAASQLHPKNHFVACLSRQLRTVVEAVDRGWSLQSCGLWRGSGLHLSMDTDHATPFANLWEQTDHHLPPQMPPDDCPLCIDVSMNVTLNFIWQILQSHPDAQFFKAHLPFNKENF